MRGYTFRIFVTASIILVATLAVGADICSGCKGTGRIGCGRCFWPFIGKCSHCTGVYSTTSPSKCTVCRGSQICPGCNGKGLPCMVCKGTGRLPDGTNALIEARRQEENKASIRQALQPFQFLAGEAWSVQGTQGARAFTGRLKASFMLEGTWCQIVDQTRYTDGQADDSAVYLTFEPANGTYFMLVLSPPGRLAVLRGPRPEGGNSIHFEVSGQDHLRLVWQLLPGTGLDSRFEQRQGSGWNRLAWSEIRRTGAAPAAAPASSGAMPGLMQRLAYLEGNWSSQGTEKGVAVTGQMACELILGGSFLKIRDKSQYSDGRRIEGEALVCGEADGSTYRMVILTAPGRSMDLRGSLSEGGRTIEFRNIGQEDQMRLLWRLQPPAGLDSALEVNSENGWQTFSSSRNRRAGAAGQK